MGSSAGDLLEAAASSKKQLGESYLGRTNLRTMLSRSVEAAAHGIGAVVLLPGDPGIGKTRTLELIADLSTANGLRVVRGGCSEVPGAPPLLPWAHILGALGHPSVLETKSPDSGGIGEDPGASFRLSRAVTDAILSEAHAAPLTLLLDDVHAADLGSARLLAFLSREVHSAPLLLVAAYRPADVPSDHPLRPVLEELGRRARTLPLDALETSDLALLAEDLTEGSVAPEVAQLLGELSQGNPLFAIQLAELLLAQGCDLGDPATVDRARIDAPQGVRHVLRARMDATPETTREVLAVGAVFGRDFDLDLVEHATRSASAPSPAPALDAAARSGIVAPLPEVPGRWRFAHVLFRDVLEEELAPAKRRELHARALRALEERRDLDEDAWLTAAAHHALESLSEPSAPKARDLARRAGERALERHSQEDAVSWFEGALRALELETDLDPEERAAETLTVLPRLGLARWRSGQVAAARADFARSLELARKVGDPTAFAEAAVGFAGRTDAVLGPEEESAALLGEALERMDPAPSRLRVDVLTRLASSLYFSPDEQRREQTSLAAIECAERLDDPGALAYALTARHYVLQRPGRLEERRAIADRTLDALRGRPEESVTVFAHYHAILDHLEAGDRAGVDRHVRAHGEIAQRLREPFALWHHEAVRATQALVVGDLTAAEEHAHVALELGQRAECLNAAAMFSGQLFCLRRAQGRLGELEPLLAPLVRDYPDVPGYAYARAEAQLALGREGEVRAFLAAGRTELTRFSRDYNWPSLMSIAARLAVALGDAESGALIYEALLPEAGRCVVFPLGSGWDGAFDLALGRLAMLLDRAEDAERHLQAAAALHARVGARIQLAETWEALAALRRESGARAEADRLVADATAIRRECGGGTTAPRASAPESVGTPDARFVVCEGGWRLAFEGREATLPDSRGLGYLAALLERPHEPIHVLDLTERRADGAGGADAGQQLDARARGEVRARMRALQSELDEAESSGDPSRTEALRIEWEQLEDELTSALGLGGRARRVGDPVDRARKAVYARIRTALSQIEAELPELARHLRHSIRTGRTCSYAPESEVRWNVAASAPSTRPGRRRD